MVSSVQRSWCVLNVEVDHLTDHGHFVLKTSQLTQQPWLICYDTFIDLSDKTFELPLFFALMMHNTIIKKLDPDVPAEIPRVLPRPFQHVDAITAMCPVDAQTMVTADRSGLMLLWRLVGSSWHPSTVLRPSGAPACDAMSYWAGAIWCLGKQTLWGISLASGDVLSVDDSLPPVLEMVLSGGALIARCARCLLAWCWDEQDEVWAERTRLEFAQHYHEDPLEMVCSPCGTLVMVNRYNQYARAHAHELFYWDLYDRQHPKHWQSRSAGQVSVFFGEDRQSLWVLDHHHAELRLTHPVTAQVSRTWPLPEPCRVMFMGPVGATARLQGVHGQWYHIDLISGRCHDVAAPELSEMTQVTLTEQACFFGGCRGGMIAQGHDAPSQVLSQGYQPISLTMHEQQWLNGASLCFETAEHVWFSTVDEVGSLWCWDRQSARGHWCESFDVPGDRLEQVAVIDRFLLLTTTRQEQHLVERRTGELVARFAWPIEQFVWANNRLWGMMPADDESSPFSLGHILCVTDLDLGTLTTIAPPPGVSEGAWLDAITTCWDGIIVHACTLNDGYQSWFYHPQTKTWSRFEHRVASTLSPREHGFFQGATDTAGAHVLWLDDRRTGWVIRDRMASRFPVTGRMLGPAPTRYNQKPFLQALALASTQRLVLGLNTQQHMLKLWNTQGVCIGQCPQQTLIDASTRVFFEAQGDRFLVHHPQRGVVLCGLEQC